MYDLAAIGALKVGQMASMQLDEISAAWNVARLREGSLVIESPEIPLDPEEKASFLHAALIENVSGQVIGDARFFIDDEKILRLQIETSDELFEQALSNLARSYADVINPESHLGHNEHDTPNLEVLLQEPSEEAFLSHDQDCLLLSSFFSNLEQDPHLKDSLFIDNSGAVGLIELVEDDPLVLVVPDASKGLVYLHHPICILDNGDTWESELEIALGAASMTKIGVDLVLGCSDESACLYLRGQVRDDQLNPEIIKDVLGVLLAVGAGISELFTPAEFISNTHESGVTGTSDRLV